MATATTIRKLNPGGQDVTDPVAGKVLKMVAAAEIDRNRHIRRMEDCYKFALPWRHKANQNQPVDQLDDIFDGELMTVLEDFAADMLNTFTPQKSEWVAPKPVATLDKAAQRQIEKPLAEYKEKIFSEMARSNLYQALQEAYMDLGPGTMALVVTDIDPAQPIHCEALPVVDLLLNRGPYGRLKGIWRKRRRTADDILSMWPEAKFEDGRELKPDDATEHECIDGVYLDMTARADETWHYCVLVDGRVVWKQTYKGKGSNPFIIARWSRDSTTAWGMGPTYRSVPEVKTLNHYRYVLLKNFDKEVDPVVSYEDDGIMNLDHGIEPGLWIGRAPGSSKPEVIESRSRMDFAAFQIDEVRKSIKRAHYQDKPEQLGKTPPSATQWADEAAERARRMGSPATNLVIELQYPLFERFAYLLAKRGKLEKIKLNGEEVALEPISPLLRAQEQEEIVRMDRFAEMIIGRFGPEMGNAVINAFAYADRLAKRLGVAPELVRDESQIQQIVQQLGPLLGGGGAPGGAPPQAMAA